MELARSISGGRRQPEHNALSLAPATFSPTRPSLTHAHIFLPSSPHSSPLSLVLSPSTLTLLCSHQHHHGDHASGMKQFFDVLFPFESPAYNSSESPTCRGTAGRGRYEGSKYSVRFDPQAGLQHLRWALGFRLQLCLSYETARLPFLSISCTQASPFLSLPLDAGGEAVSHLPSR